MLFPSGGGSPFCLLSYLVFQRLSYSSHTMSSWLSWAKGQTPWLYQACLWKTCLCSFFAHQYRYLACCLFQIKNLGRGLHGGEDMDFILEWQKQYLRSEVAEWVISSSFHEKIDSFLWATVWCSLYHMDKSVLLGSIHVTLHPGPDH